MDHSRFCNKSFRQVQPRFEKRWIRNNIKIKYVSKNEMVDEMDKIDEIDAKQETVLEPTDAAGSIAFKGATRETNAHYVRLSDETELETVHYLLKNIWKLETPRLLISVTGGAKSFHLQPELKDLFEKGLLKVAQTPGTWVITGGTNTGVMKHVSTAIKGTTNACIGIAPWGIISNSEKLTERGDYEKEYKVSSSMVEGGAYLDHNHTHFLLVDDGSIKQYGREMVFRAKLEKYIMQIEKVPCVLLVLQGGVETIGAIYSSVTGEPPVPVVIIKGSGGAADCLSYAIDTINEHVDCFHGEVHKGLDKKIKESFNVESTKRIETYKAVYKQVLDCVKLRHLIKVCRIGSGGSSLDEAMLDALLTTTHDQKIIKNDDVDADAEDLYILGLCIYWDRPDLAQKKLFPYAAQVKDFDSVYSNCAMIMALALDRVEFVRILLEYGVIISLSQEILEFLYGYRSKIESCLKSHFEENDYKPTNVDNEIQNIFQLLCSYENIDSNNVSVSVKIQSIDAIANLFPKLCNGETIKLTGRFPIDDIETLETFQNPNEYLFFWALLNNMRDMALCFWQFEKEGMLMALAAAYISKTLADQPDVPEKLQNAMKQTANLFTNLSVQLLDECSIANEELTEKLIEYSSDQFNTQTCLNLAVELEHLEYVSHSSVQSILKKQWTGPHQLTNLSMIKAVLFPFAIKKIITTETDSKKPDESEVSEYEMIQDTSPTDSYRVSMISSRSHQEDHLVAAPTTCKYTIEFHNSPLVKFYRNVVAYFIYLVIFSYVAMLEKHGQKPYSAEYVSLLVVISLLFEEINQLQSVSFGRWWSNYWNRLDAAAISLSLIAFGIHYWYPFYPHVHLVYAMAAGLWILRLLNIFQANRILGPYIVMIYRMFIDMMYFLVILCVFLVAYGVSVKAILHPQTSGVEMFKDMLFQPYFNVYGELFLADSPNNVTTRFGTPITNRYAEPIAWILLGIYLLIANVLLLNLLIAIFNNTFNDVQENSAQIWKYKMYFLIMEYKDRPPLVPPFILLCHICLLCKWIKSKIQCCLETKEENSLNKVKVKDEKLMTFEAKCMASLMRKRSPVKQDEQTEKFQELLDQKQKTDHRLKELEDKIDKKFEEFENRIIEKICQK